MSEQVLTVLKFCLLALLYLFLARVVWVVARELRGTAGLGNVAVAGAPAVAAAAPARTRRRAWRLVTVEPNGAGDHWIEGEATIGRGGGCTVALPTDTFVSQVHARVVDRDGDLWIEDLGSTNGTFVNGKQVRDAQRLRKGDRVQVGETVFEADR